MSTSGYISSFSCCLFSTSSGAQRCAGGHHTLTRVTELELSEHSSHCLPVTAMDTALAEAQLLTVYYIALLL